jgi:hypothetical protein
MNQLLSIEPNDIYKLQQWIILDTTFKKRSWNMSDLRAHNKQQVCMDLSFAICNRHHTQ